MYFDNFIIYRPVLYVIPFLTGSNVNAVITGKVKTFILVAPVLDPYERTGSCTIHVDSRPVDKRTDIMRDTINIEFNTSLDENMDIDTNIVKKCEHIDEDPLNDCKPVDCDVYYNGQKPIFDENTKRCTVTPKCRNKKSENSVYDPVLNKCMVIDPVNNEDLDFIKSLSVDRSPKDEIVVKSSDSVLSNSALYKYMLNITKSDAVVKDKLKNDIKKTCIYSSLVEYILSNKYTLLVLGIVIFVQCFLICTMIYCLTKSFIYKDGKKVERKYFNYRQDVSATTPLIATSNMDTDTAFDYVSETSNVEKKIKCYKACQKERKTDPKISMSDDILTKCLNRRDWSSKPKSDITKDINDSYSNNFIVESKVVLSNIQQTTVIKSPKIKVDKGTATETENEKAHEKQAYRTSIVEKDYNNRDSSEKLIQCHDYNIALKITKDKCKKGESMSTEKGAQACFSNDSIDDYLSERGMVHLAGERLSKYSLSTTTDSTGTSSKTSKNRNMVKNVLSYLSRKSKKYTSSDPGANKKGEGKDLELIHMSTASMYSSSTSEYKNILGMKLVKDCRSTF